MSETSEAINSPQIMWYNRCSWSSSSEMITTEGHQFKLELTTHGWPLHVLSLGYHTITAYTVVTAAIAYR